MPTLLQISDPHLLSDPAATLKGVPTAESLRFVLQRARREVADPARVVLSGDLSHEHTVAGYELLRELLGDWSDRAVVIPGNHDDRAAMRAVFPQVPGEGDEDIWFLEEVAGWRLIGLDSHVPGELFGAVSETTLKRLDGWLAVESAPPTLVFLHHPPVPVNSPWLDSIGLRDAGAFASVLARHHHVKGLFGGHVHQVFIGEFAGIPFCTAPSASFQFKPETQSMQFDTVPPGFRVIELDAATSTTWSTRVVRLDEPPFVPRI